MKKITDCLYSPEACMIQACTEAVSRRVHWREDGGEKILRFCAEHEKFSPPGDHRVLSMQDLLELRGSSEKVFAEAMGQGWLFAGSARNLYDWRLFCASRQVPCIAVYESPGRGGDTNYRVEWAMPALPFEPELRKIALGLRSTQYKYAPLYGGFYSNDDQQLATYNFTSKSQAIERVMALRDLDAQLRDDNVLYAYSILDQ